MVVVVVVVMRSDGGGDGGDAWWGGARRESILVNCPPSLPFIFSPPMLYVLPIYLFDQHLSLVNPMVITLIILLLSLSHLLPSFFCCKILLQKHMMNFHC